MKKPPPPPPGWNKTIAELFAEVKAGQRHSVSSPEIDWARDFEKSLLPKTLRFPCKGYIYEALEDVETNYLTSWAAPFTGGGVATILQKERIEISSIPATERPLMVYAHPLAYRDVEKRVVPAADRRARGYMGFSFVIRTTDLNAKFRLLEAEGGNISA